MPDFLISSSPFGLGVVAGRRFRRGEPLFPFTGERLKKEELPVIFAPEDDRYVRVGQDFFFDPSGGFDDCFDDFVNHSCDPNCGLVFDGDRVQLVAIRMIAPGEELFWDYSTTMDEDGWELACRCGSPLCRGRVKDFKHLPVPLRLRYAKLGIIPPYLLRYVPAVMLVSNRVA